MTVQKNNHVDFLDEKYEMEEQLPRLFSISFYQSLVENQNVVRVMLDDIVQVGDIVDDNAYDNDYYRYHDIFHYSFATMLGWSPCARAMMKCKRKSNKQVDKIEDGARAAITEEAISMIIFNEAKKKEFFKSQTKISKTILRIVKEITEPFEVKIRNEKEWQIAILRAYDMFRLLVENKGGKVSFDSFKKEMKYTFLDN